MMMLLCFAFLGVARAQQELTIYEDGTTTNSYVPIYGLWADAYLKCEFVVPAEELIEMANGTISQMTYYLSSPAAAAWTGTFQVFLKEVDYTTIDAFSGTEGATIVYEGLLDGTQSTMDVEFSENYTYGGGNLLVGFYQIQKGNYKGCSFFGQTVTGASVQGYSSSSLDNINPSQKNFIPRTTFTYVSSGGTVCEKPATLETSNLNAHGVTLTWTGGSGNYNLEYKANSAEEWTSVLSNSTATTYNLTGLAQNTAYQARVQSVCGSSVSGWKTVSFSTPIACPAPTGLTCTGVTASSATISWIAGGEETAWQICVNNDEENLIDVTSNPYTLTSLEPETSYNVKVRAYCDAVDQSSWTSNISVYTGYCIPSCSTVDGNGISNVTFGVGDFVVNNDTPKATYANYYQMIGALQAGVESTISITYATGYTYGTIIWVDFDNSMSFEEDEIIYMGTSESANPTTLEAAVTIPATQATGDYRMRIGGADSGFDAYIAGTSTTAPNPCYSGSWGCLQDYTLRVLPAPSCLTPTDLAVNYTGGTTAEVSWVSDASNFNISVNGNVTNNVGNPYMLTGLNLSTTYEVKVQAKCNASDISEWTNPVSFTTDMCMPENQCDLTFVLTDSWGDSWNGNAIQVVDVATGMVIATMANENLNGTSGSGENEVNTLTLPVCDGRELQFVWVMGSYPAETSWVITDINEEEICSGTGSSDMATGQVLATYTVNCTPVTCKRPKALTCTAVDNHNATLSWTAGGDETEWRIAYGTTPDFDPTKSDYQDVSSNPATITGLAPETTYYAYIRANCGAGDVSAYSTTYCTFTTDVACPTPVLTVTNLMPTSATIEGTGSADSYILRYRASTALVYDFESAEPWVLDDFPPCTTFDGDGLGTYAISGYTMPNELNNYVGSVISFSDNDQWEAHSGETMGVFMDAVPGDEVTTNNDFFILPATAIETGFQFKFWARSVTSNYGLERIKVGVYDGNGGLSSYLEGSETTYASVPVDWTEYSYDLTSYVGQTIQLAINCVSADAFALLFDDIYLGNPNASTWDETVSNVELPYDLAGLTPETLYEVQVQANCGVDGESEWAVVSFTTPGLCQTPTRLAASDIHATTATLTWNGFQEQYNVRYRTAENKEQLFFDDFENDNENGWINDGGIYYFTGDESNHFVLLGYTSTETQYLITPDLSSYQGAETVEFYYKVNGTATTFEVGYSSTTTDAEAFTWDAAISATYNSSTLFSEAIPSGTKYIAVRTTGIAFIIDDFGIYGAIIPAGAWVDLQTEAPEALLQGLSSETTYEVQVQGICSKTETTDWTSLITFTTLDECVAPFNVEVSDETFNSAVLTWEGEQETYNIQYWNYALLDKDVFTQVGSDVTTDAVYTQYTFDLSAYAGQEGYIAIRHYNVTDQYYLIVDDILVTDANGNTVYSQDMESDDIDLSIWDTDLDGFNWGLWEDEEQSYTGSTYFLYSASYSNSYGALYPDNWLVTPKVALGGTFSVYAMGMDPNYPEEVFGVFVTTEEFADPVETVVVEGVTSPYTITGLAPSTIYIAQVQGVNPNCGSGVTNWSSSYGVILTDEAPVVTELDQTYAISAGWNWMSSYLECSDELFTALKEGIAANNTSAVIKNMDGSVMLQSTGWSGNLAFLNESMYMMSMPNATEVTLTAAPADPAEHPITLAPGWNWIGFISANDMTVSEALANITPTSGDVIKNMDGVTTFTGGIWQGSLPNLEAGNGYMYYNKAASNVTLVYPASAKAVVRSIPVEKYWNTNVHEHATNLVLMATLDENQFQMAEGNYEIGAFVDGECRGSARLQRTSNGFIAFLVIHGEFEESIRFQLYDVMNGKEVGDGEEELRYVPNAIRGSIEEPMVLHFRGVTDVNEDADRLSVYPNPAKDNLKIEGNAIEMVSVYDLLGQCMFSETFDKANNVELNMSGLSAGVYMVSIRNNGTMVNKMIVKE